MNTTELKFCDLFHLTDEELNRSKIVLNMTAGIERKECLDIWLTSKDRQTDVRFSYWSHYGKQRNFSLNNIVFGFVRMGSDRYLLVTVGKIIDVPGVHDEPRHCGFEPLHAYDSLLGRLIINVSKGDTYSRYVFNLDRYLKTIVIEQILRVEYGTQPFPGFENLNIPYEKLKHQIDYEELKGPLTSVNGIYLLHDKHTGKNYVGSATGNQGIYGRWKTYLANGYDQTEEESGKPYPNNKLKSLVQTHKISYIENHFVFSILEVLPKVITRDQAIQRENHWKDVLQTKDDRFGYNSN
jgi:hypothetical protein